MNPYQVLGVREGASQEEIKAAYREKVKKYHPDRYAGNPLQDLASEKLKEINEAYDMLTKNAGASSSAGGYGSGGYSSSSGSSYAGSDLGRARQMLNAGNVAGAFNLLNNISVRNAEWHYLMGIVRLRQGAYDAARSEMQTAVQMDPNNAEYRQAYASLNNFGNRYGGNQAGNVDMCSVCSTLYCMDCCCESMGGNLIPCVGCR